LSFNSAVSPLTAAARRVQPLSSQVELERFPAQQSWSRPVNAWRELQQLDINDVAP